MTRLPIRLDEKTARALIKLAEREYRDPRVQAVLIIRQELIRLGLLPQGNQTTKEDLPITNNANVNTRSHIDTTTSGDFSSPTGGGSATQN